MKRFQSILCASFLTLAISATALAGDIHTAPAPRTGDIHTIAAPRTGDIHTIAAPRSGDIHTIVRSILMLVAAIG